MRIAQSIMSKCQSDARLLLAALDKHFMLSLFAAKLRYYHGGFHPVQCHCEGQGGSCSYAPHHCGPRCGWSGHRDCLAGKVTLTFDWVHVGVGTIMGAAAQFNVTVRGKGGHAAMPHTTVDPVVAGAAIVTALQVKMSNMHATLDAL